MRQQLNHIEWDAVAGILAAVLDLLSLSAYHRKERPSQDYGRSHRTLIVVVESTYRMRQSPMAKTDGNYLRITLSVPRKALRLTVSEM